MEVMDKFEKNITLMLKEKGYSQSELARKLGIGKSTVNNWIRLHKEPTITNIVKIMKELNCSFDELVE